MVKLSHFNLEILSTNCNLIIFEYNITIVYVTILYTNAVSAVYLFLIKRHKLYAPNRNYSGFI